MTADEQYSHVSLWALLSAPLLIGCDLASIDKFTLNLLCNNEIIAVNQDPLGKQADCLWEADGLQVWAKPLADGAYAAGVFNHGEKAVVVNLKEILEKAGLHTVDSCRDLWKQQECPESVSVQSHGVVMVKFNTEK